MAEGEHNVGDIRKIVRQEHGVARRPEYADSITPYAIPIASQRQITVSSEVENNVRDVVEIVGQEEGARRARTKDARRVYAVAIPITGNRQIAVSAKVEADRGDDAWTYTAKFDWLAQ